MRKPQAGQDAGRVETSSGLNLQRFLPYRLAALARAISHELAECYAREYGISTPEWRVIGHLAEVPKCSSGEICARTAMDKATVNRAVTRLVTAGLVLAEVSQKDRRLNVLQLSAKGRTLYRTVVPVALELEAQLLGELTDSEQAILYRALDRLARRIAIIQADRGASGPARDFDRKKTS